MATFHQTQLVRCPSVVGWYMELNLSDGETVEKMHQGVVRRAFDRYKPDPHPPHANPPLWENPVYLGTAWLNAINIMLFKGVDKILINSVGGWMTFGKNVKILKTIVSDKWPSESIENETIIITRWPLAKHYYLSSSNHRIFLDKHNSLESAMEEAKRYVPVERIIVNENGAELSSML